MDDNQEVASEIKLFTCHVEVVNNLNDEITGVQVCYVESAKGSGISYLYNIKTVDVETEECANWKNVLSFCDIPSMESGNSQELVYYGHNRGYWQVYFRYKRDEFKINKNNANFNLGRSDQGQTVTIEILQQKKGFLVKIRAPSGHDYFTMEKGSPIQRGVFVVIRNELMSEISDVRLVYAESTMRDVDVESERNVVWKENVTFHDQTVGRNQETRSTDCLLFSYHNSFWQVYFTYDGKVYKLERNNAQFNLRSKDNGRTLIITVCNDQESLQKSISVKFNMSSSKCTFAAKMEESVRLRQIRCREMLSTLPVFTNFAQFQVMRNNILKILGEIAHITDSENSNTTPWGFSKMFYRLEDQGDESIVIAEPNQLKFSPDLYNDETVNLLTELKHLLDEEARFETQLRERLNEVETLSNGQSWDHNPCSKFLYGFGIAGELLELVGINNFGLTVKVGSNVDCGINPAEFANALIEETRLLDLCFRPSSGEITAAEMDQIQSLLIHAFLREFDKYELITRETIQTMRRIASSLHDNTQNVAITKTTGGVVGIAGGVLLTVGLALEPLTLGASTPLVITGIALVASSGVLNMGAAIGDAVARKIIVAKLKQSLNEKVLLRTLASLTELIEHVSIRESDTTTPPGSIHLSESLGKAAGNVARVGAVAGLATGLKLIGEGGLQALRNTFRFGAVAVGIAFDLVTVFDGSFTLATGAKSELGYKWAYNAEQLEVDLNKTRGRINHYIVSTPPGAIVSHNESPS